MAQVKVKEILITKEQAQFILEGVRFFRTHPQAKEWHQLDKEVFLLSVQNISQFVPNKEENLEEYLLRLDSFLQRLINNEEQAPSVPANLQELVSAWDEFEKEKNADKKVAAKLTQDISDIRDITIENWLNKLQNDYREQRVNKQIDQTIDPLDLSQEKKTQLKNSLKEAVKESVPASVIVDKQAQDKLKQKIADLNKDLDQNRGAVFSQNEKQAIKAETEKLADQSGFFNVPLAAKTPSTENEERLKQVVNQVILEKTPLQDSQKTSQIAEIISQSLQEKVPRQEATGLNDLEQIALTQATITASLPQITQSLTSEELTGIRGGLNLTANDAKEFLSSLTAEVNQPLVELATNLSQELKTKKNQEKIGLFKTEGQNIVQALEENPLLPYQTTPDGVDANLNEQFSAIVGQYGINSDSTEIIAYRNEEIEALSNAIIGKNSEFWQQKISWLRTQGQENFLLEQTENNYLSQIRFETNFPQLGNFFRQSSQLPWFKKITNQITSPLVNSFEGKLKTWWQNTNLAKNLAKSAQSKTGIFFKKALGSLNIFKAGAGEAIKEGAKKGASKALVWLSKKLAGTKLGTMLGSIAPGVGNAVGFIIGLGLDLVRGGFKLASGFLEKMTGSETETEREIKANLGPLGKISLTPLVLIIGGVVLLIITMAFGLFQIEGSAFINDETVIVQAGAVHSSRVIYPSKSLAELIRQVAQETCVPEALLLAVSRTEASGAWGYSEEEFALYSTPGWQDTADEATIRNGYCYNTCDVWGCSADVRGIMQFTDTTFAGYHDQLVAILGREPDRCLIPDSIYAAALKIKADSGTGSGDCQIWSDDIVIQVAEAYCGACNSQFCPSYCDTVLAYYHEFVNDNTLDIILNPPDNDNGALAEEIALIMSDCDGLGTYGYINRNTAEAAKTCINSSSLGEDIKTAMTSLIDYQVDAYTSLQCVGFVGTIENLVGRNFPGCGSAAYQWGQESCWPTSQYAFLGDNISLVQGGDIAVNPNTSPGHIGFISQRTDDEAGGETRFRFTSAWGDSNGQGGNITIETVPASYFESRGYVFIRPL